MNAERRFDIDWIRVIAIGLLLIYHIAIVFQPWAMFIGFIRSDESIEGLWTVMSLLNVWRIPLLFYISGMGLFFALRKRGWKQILLERGKRILLPFLFGVLAITPLHMFVFQSYYNMPLDYFPHLGHLWFLGNICVYVIVLTPIFLYLQRQDSGLFMTFIRKLLAHPLGLLSMALLLMLEVLVIKPSLFELYAETWHGLALGMLAFFFGFLFMQAGSSFWKTVSNWKWLYFSLAIGMCAIRISPLMNLPAFLVALESFCWIIGIFGLGHQYLSRSNRALSYLSQAAYPVYIIHMFVLYGASAVILPLEIPAFLQFILIVALTYLICYLLYELVIRRVNFLRPLFGLKWKSQGPKASEMHTKAVVSH